MAVCGHGAASPASNRHPGARVLCCRHVGQAVSLRRVVNPPLAPSTIAVPTSLAHTRTVVPPSASCPPYRPSKPRPTPRRHSHPAYPILIRGVPPALKKVLISYCHLQGEWVWDRLHPCLVAGGAEVLIDRTRFEAGLAVFDQMDPTPPGPPTSSARAPSRSRPSPRTKPGSCSPNPSRTRNSGNRTPARPSRPSSGATAASTASTARPMAGPTCCN